jgi:predicted metal-dependent hydrolase
VSAERFVYEKAVWIIRQRQRMEKIPERTVVPGGYWHFVGHKADARRLIMELIEELNKVYQVTIPKVTVRNPRTRWGSCSRDGRLSFSYKIMFLPTSVQRYIVAHELSHRKEFNHSKKFWAWVKKTIPDYEKHRKDLRQWSLRSRDGGVDVSEVARAMGGGGHRNAAGFEERAGRLTGGNA